MKKLKIGVGSAAVLLAGILAILRVTGLEPEYMDYTTEAYNQRGRMTYPGLWLTGEVVREPLMTGTGFRKCPMVRGNTIGLRPAPGSAFPTPSPFCQPPEEIVCILAGAREENA